MQSELKDFGEPLWNLHDAREIDRQSTEEFGISGLALMETAGRAAAAAIRAHLQEGAPILFLIGPGNNGGDGLVAARALSEENCEVHLFDASFGKELSPSCASQWKTVTSLGFAKSDLSSSNLNPYLNRRPLIVDAVFGLGFRGPLADPVKKILSEVSAIESKLVCAIDIPTGLNGDSGEEQDIPLRADVTITFGGLKPSQVLSPARDLCGRVHCCDIGFPRRAVDAGIDSESPRFGLANSERLVGRDPWAALPASAHKYDHGHVLVLGGSQGKSGAPILAAMAALRTGAGWVSVSVPSAVRTEIENPPIDLTFEDLFAGDEIDADKLALFLQERKVGAIVVGPGCMTSPLTERGMDVISDYSASGGFTLIDAGATHGIIQKMGQGRDRASHRWLMTPHPGEWKKLGQDLPAPLNAEGLQVCHEMATKIGATLLYKGATPIAVPPNPSQAIIGLVTDEGDPVLARAGSGDILSGCAAAHGAVGCDATFAALRGQILVAQAARKASFELGRRAPLASDIVQGLGRR